MKPYPAAAAALVIAGQSVPVYAQVANRDVHCLMLSNLFAKEAPVAQAKLAASQARLFYLGRVSGKLVPAQLAPAMATEAKTVDIDHAGPDMTKCLDTVQAAAAAVEAAGKKARGAAAGPTGR